MTLRNPLHTTEFYFYWIPRLEFKKGNSIQFLYSTGSGTYPIDSIATRYGNIRSELLYSSIGTSSYNGIQKSSTHKTKFKLK